MDCLSQIPQGLKLSSLCAQNSNCKDRDEDDSPPFYPEDRASQASTIIIVDDPDFVPPPPEIVAIQSDKQPKVRKNAKKVKLDTETVASTTDANGKRTQSFGIQCQPETRNIGVQTIEYFPPATTKTEAKKEVQFADYKPMYSLPRRENGQPPLKVGMSLRGKKRKVYYPDEIDLTGEAA